MNVMKSKWGLETGGRVTRRGRNTVLTPNARCALKRPKPMVESLSESVGGLGRDRIRFKKMGGFIQLFSCLLG